MIGTTITQKGQATIPHYIRKKLGLRTGQKVYFEERKGEVILKGTLDLSSLRGSLKTSRIYTADEASKAIGRMLAKRHEKTARY